MHDTAIAFPALVVIRGAVAAVWLYERLWNKLLGWAQRESDIVAMVPKLGPLFGKRVLHLLGVVEVAIAAWILSGIYPGSCAIVQIALLVVLNIDRTLSLCFEASQNPSPNLPPITRYRIARYCGVLSMYAARTYSSDASI